MTQYHRCEPSRQVKILWQQLPGFKLKATWSPKPRGFEYGLSESDMNPIHEWCAEVGIGVRTSFDMWKFQNSEEITMFLLKWS